MSERQTRKLLRDARREIKLYIIGAALLNGWSDAAINSKLRGNRVIKRLDAALLAAGGRPEPVEIS